MSLSRPELLLVVALLWLLGVAIVLARLLRSRTHGLSIRMQVFLAVSLIAALVTAAFSYIVIDRFDSRAVLFAHRAARSNAEIVGELSSRAMKLADISLRQGAAMLKMTNILYTFSDENSDTRVQILDDKGRLLFDTRKDAPAESGLAQRPEVKLALSGKIDRIARILPRHRVVAAVPILFRNKVVGVSRVIMSTRGMTQTLADVAPKIALLALILLGAAAFAALMIGHSIASPLVTLTQVAERIAAGEKQTDLPAPHGREVAKLTSAFARMRHELEQRDAVERMASNLSHELKNSVAAMRASAEVLEDAIEHDPEAARRFARHIGEAAQRLNLLLRDQLDLARLEAQGVQKLQKVDLHALCQELIENNQDRAEAQGLTLVYRGEKNTYVHADQLWLLRALQNLLDNALAHSRKGDRVFIDLQKRDDSVQIRVRDQGPGVAEALRERIFERFVSTRHEQGGSGLGLSIVRAILEAHGGTVFLAESEKNAENPEKPGAVFVVLIDKKLNEYK